MTLCRDRIHSVRMMRNARGATLVCLLVAGALVSVATGTAGGAPRSPSFAARFGQHLARHETLRQRAWAAGTTPGALTIDVDSTICEVVGKAGQGAGISRR